MTHDYVKRGDLLRIKAEWYNDVIDLLRREYSLERGIVDSAGVLTKEYKEHAHEVIEITTIEDIERYSIFTVDNDSVGYVGTGSGDADYVDFDLEIPTAYSKKFQIGDKSKPYIVNYHIDCEESNRYILPILGMNKPFLVRYYPDDGTPVLGEAVGIKPTTYLVSTAYTGCLCVSSPDTTNELIWIVRATGTLELVELCAQETASRSVPYTALLGTWDADLHSWCYDGAETVYAIDHRVGPPYAESGWKGLYQAMPSNTYGTIYDCVSLDCELPDEGCACSGTGS